MVFLQPRRIAFGSSAYWRHRRRVAIARLRDEGWIGEVGPGGQVLWAEHVGSRDARRWWRRSENLAQAWLRLLLLSGALALLAHHLLPGERAPMVLALALPPLVHVLAVFLRPLRT